MTVYDNSFTTETINMEVGLEFSERIIGVAPVSIITTDTPTLVLITLGTEIFTYVGSNFITQTVDGGKAFVSGTLTSFTQLDSIIIEQSITGASVDVATWISLENSADLAGLQNLFFGSDDTIFGSFFDDKLLGNAGNDTLRGGSGNDSIQGQDGNDTINGNSNNDTLKGGNGDDRILGGRDNDTVIGNKGNDTVNGNKGNDSVLGGKNDDLARGGQGDDFINGNNDNDSVFGDKGNDTVHGGKANDIVDGGEGNDLVYGDKGNDVLTGGEGADIFVFSAGSEIDIITDFVSGTDKIQIASDVIATAAAAVAAFSGGVLTLSSTDSVGLTGITSVTEADFVIV